MAKRKETGEPGKFPKTNDAKGSPLPFVAPSFLLSTQSLSLLSLFGTLPTSLSLDPFLKKKKKKPLSAIPACLAFTFYTISNEEHHAGEKPERTYTNVRSKPFPWGEDALFTKKGGHH